MTPDPNKPLPKDDLHRDRSVPIKWFDVGGVAHGIPQTFMWFLPSQPSLVVKD